MLGCSKIKPNPTGRRVAVRSRPDRDIRWQRDRRPGEKYGLAAMGKDLAETIGQYVADMTYDALPSEAVKVAKRSMLDTLGVAWAGSDADGCPSAYELMRAQGGRGESTVWVYGNRLPATSTAFLNSLFASALDYDGIHSDAVIHSDIVVLPGALAMAEREHASGREFLTALVIGNDLACRLGLSTPKHSGWFYTSMYGVFAAGAVSAKLQRLDAESTRNTLGLTFINAAGTQQPAVERSLAKRMQSACACQAGVLAGLLAGRGLSGPRAAFEGQFGLYRMYEDGDPTIVTRDLGIRFENVGISLKRYPSCNCNHAVLDGTLNLVGRHNLGADEVAEVEVRLSPYMNRLVGAPFDPGDNPQVTAQFSVQYSVACAILRRRFGLADLRDEAVHDPKIRKLAAKVRVIVDETSSAVVVPAEVSIRMVGGDRFDIRVDRIRGTPEDPLGDDELWEKFHECAGTGAIPMSEAERAAMIDVINNIEDVGDMETFFTRVFGGARRSLGSLEEQRAG